MADELNRDEEDLLQPAHLRRVSLANSTPSQIAAPPEPSGSSSTEDATASAEASSKEEEWKREYDGHVSEWRQRSAEQREKAELERKRWEEIRAAEKAQAEKEGLIEGSGDKEKAEGDVKEWESVSVSLGPGSTRVGSVGPSVADARDLVTGEAQGSGKPSEPAPSLSTTSSPHEPLGAGHDRANSNNGSGEKWEDVPVPSSMTSSYPSLSYPSDPHSPVSSLPNRDLPHHDHHHSEGHPHDHRHLERAQPQATTTSAIFDSSLSAKTRTLALLSSLTINLLLPFVNGVMLGFGEIYARNVVVKWFSWGRTGEQARGGRPGSVATSVGVNATDGKRNPWKS